MTNFIQLKAKGDNLIGSYVNVGCIVSFASNNEGTAIYTADGVFVSAEPPHEFFDRLARLRGD